MKSTTVDLCAALDAQSSVGTTSYARSATSDRSKCGPCVAWSSPGRPDIPEIRPEIPRGGISKRLSVLIYTLFADSSESVRSTADVCLTGLLTPKDR